MSLLLHFSDTHFGTEQPEVVAALLALAVQRRPQALVFSGDITQRARREEFAAARRFCDQLGDLPLLVLPGNHDIPLWNLAARLSNPYAGFQRAFGTGLEPVVETADLLLVGVNTTRRWLHKDGKVSPAQIEQVRGRLASAKPAQLRIVVTHQPSEVSRPKDQHDRLRGGEAALQAWSQAGADLVLGGHIHLPYVMDLHARAQPTPRRTWCVQAGTAVSDRIRHGTCNSVNLIHWQPKVGAPRTCTVERCDYDAATGRFESASTSLLALD
ncbi:MAG: metallophosphoesterase [Haliea sp.]|nr:MAG: metallophosphoesterase [Haliea sp.]